MARKTKKKKIISEYRRRMKRMQMQRVATMLENIQSTKPKQVSSRPQIQPKVAINTKALDAQRILVIGDLRKTIFLSAIAIGALIVISLSTNS